MEDKLTETLRRQVHAAAVSEAVKYAGPAWVRALEHAEPCPRCEGTGYVVVHQRKFMDRPVKLTRHTCRECKGYGVDLTAALSELGLEPRYRKPEVAPEPQPTQPTQHVPELPKIPEAGPQALPLRFRSWGEATGA